MQKCPLVNIVIEMPPLRGWLVGDRLFYIDATPTGLKRREAEVTLTEHGRRCYICRLGRADKFTLCHVARFGYLASESGVARFGYLDSESGSAKSCVCIYFIAYSKTHN